MHYLIAVVLLSVCYRCKLFFKIGNEFKDRGIGNLYLKPCGEKTQLLVRAGTALGKSLALPSMKDSLCGTTVYRANFSKIPQASLPILRLAVANFFNSVTRRTARGVNRNSGPHCVMLPGH